MSSDYDFHNHAPQEAHDVQPDFRTHVAIPAWLAQKLFSCYYGGAPRFNEPETQPASQEQPTPRPPLQTVPRFPQNVRPMGVAARATSTPEPRP